MLPPQDRELVQIVDSALADAARRSGSWLACRPGCTQCCVGVFAINPLDAERLRKGLSDLRIRDPERASRIRRRARRQIARIAAEFPGDVDTGILAEDRTSKQRFLHFADEEPCPALDPQTGTCDLYTSRPLTCRVFGPPVRSGSENALAVCELCFQGATVDEIAACEMHVDPDNLETALLLELEQATTTRGNTIVAFCLAGK